LDWVAVVGAPRCEDPELIIRVINFELVRPICSRYINVTDRQTDRLTDRGTETYDSNHIFVMGSENACILKQSA